MAYVPPHKRHSKDKERPLPSPELPPPQTRFRQNPRIKSPNSHGQTNRKIIYAKQAISEWFVVGFHDHDHGDDDHQRPPLQLQPISLEYFERKSGDKPLILVNSNIHLAQSEAQGTHARSPWEVVADNVLQHLLSSFENVRSEMEVQNLELEQDKPTLVARFGKILFHFHRGPSVTPEALRKKLADETMLGKLNRTFYTNIPTSYMDKMTKVESLKVGLDFTEEKDLYQVKLSDANRPGATISCKCSIMKEQNKLQLYKIELNQVRHMVTDISCLTRNLDMRLMLTTKRILTALKDDEMQCIQNLIESAVLDPNVKGGLRWPLGKASSGDRFSVCGVWHTISKAYKNPSMRLKVRHADRFDFRKSMGEDASEVCLKLKGIVSLLQLHPISLESIERNFGEKPLILVNTPWKVVADNVLQDLLSSFQNVRTSTEMEAQHLQLEQQVKPATALFVRLGKILFHRKPSVTPEAMTKNLAAGTMLRQLHRIFYRNLPTSYVDKMTKGESLKVGLDFKEEKDLYHVKLSDANRPEETISCKCSIMKEQNKLQLYKIELKKVRHMVTDISCLTKNLDVRLILCTKRTLSLTALKDDEMKSIKDLIESAVLDPNEKSGLRWPLGIAYSGDRYSVDEVWHTTTKAYINPSLRLRLKVEHVYRFYFRTSVDESTYEVYLKLKGIVSLLQEQKVDIGLISKMLEDNFKLIWDHFLSCDHFLG